MQHAVGARRLRAGAEPPMLLWVLLVRSAQNAILRHAVKLPRYVALDSITGVISLARCGCVPSSCRCAPPRHRAADGDAAGAHAGTSVAYELYGVMLYHSAEVRTAAARAQWSRGGVPARGGGAPARVGAAPGADRPFPVGARGSAARVRGRLRRPLLHLHPPRLEVIAR
ncbi:hypothetical protein M885DRAFT_205342 [Pelagophyceae sp. CCMP2097]|nr:hypothetical protein M885DRAFT_205342 [Pelagophyceae sp. CCMP2097]